MALRIRFQYQTGSTLGYSIERLSDGLFWDFGVAQAFVASPVTIIQSLPEDTGSFAGRYKLTLASTPSAQFTDGDYCITVHNTASGNAVVAELGATFVGGDDKSALGAVKAQTDKFLFDGSNFVKSNAQVVPFTYVAPDNTSIAAIKTQTDKFLFDGSNFVKSNVQVAPQVVLAANGLDNIVVETGVNARQALSPILAAAAGQISGATGTPGTITVKAGNAPSITRMTVASDGRGNRSSVTLNLPA